MRAACLAADADMPPSAGAAPAETPTTPAGETGGGAAQLKPCADRVDFVQLTVGGGFKVVLKGRTDSQYMA